MPRFAYTSTAGALLKPCLLLAASGLMAPVGAVIAQQHEVKTVASPKPLFDLRNSEAIAGKDPLLDIESEQIDLKQALARWSKVSRIAIHANALENLIHIPVKLSLRNRTPVEALSAIMGQVPGGGFVFVAGHGGEVGQAYVLGGSDTGRAAGASSNIVFRPLQSSSHELRHAGELARSKPQTPEAEYIANELLVQFPAEFDRHEVRDLVAAHGGEILGTENDPLHKIGYYRLRFSDETDVAAIAATFVNQTSAEAVERNYRAHAMSPHTNDTFYSRQWGLIRIRVPAAWELTRGERDVLVAILDSGVDSTHPELAHALIEGWDFIANDADAFDEEGHGTAMAGIIAAAADNEQGIAGIAPGIRLMPVRVLDGTGTGSYADVMRGLIHAADQGAQIINMSFGGYGESRALSLAVAYAHERGALLIAAAGNDGLNGRVFPAADPRVIGVASTNPWNGRSEVSNWGNHVLLAAPGERIPTLLPNARYALVTGTSGAAAQVTGIAALMFSVNPELLNIEGTQLLVETAEDLGQLGIDEFFGSGLVNAAHAVNAAARL